MKFKDFTHEFIKHVQSIYGKGSIPLHRPVFDHNEKQMLSNCIESNFVSTAGEEIGIFENKISKITSSSYTISTVSGTAALHAVLYALGVGEGDEVITQCLSFVATANAIKYCNADPIFLDVENVNGTLSPKLLRKFFQEKTSIIQGKCVNIHSGKIIKACIVMHTFGHPAHMNELAAICDEFSVELIEDGAEALGSLYHGEHVGIRSFASIYSFNGNKIVTTGGGGCVTTDDEEFAAKIKHITTTAKQPHEYEYLHDELGFNYRMPNLNACLGIAQLEKLSKFIEQKRTLTQNYRQFFSSFNYQFWLERAECESNYWLNTVSFSCENEKYYFLQETNKNFVMTRPVWVLLHKLPIFDNSSTFLDGTAERIYETTVNIPSSVPSFK